MDEETTESGPRERLLSLLTDELSRHRNALAQLHHGAARNHGAKSPSEVMTIVRRGIVERTNYQPWRGRDDREEWRQILSLLEGNRELWATYAGWVITWERLPLEVRDREKKARGATYREEWLRQQKPTEKQLEFLRVLGCSAVPESKAQASEWIDRLKSRRGVPA
jgi:hypothetical protein